jgi:acetoin utilization deacetylase AcuC-like enzyme
MQNSWPLDSGNADSPWFIPSNIDIGILQNEEDAYLEKLSRGLEELKSKYKKPDIAIIVNGSDPYEHDELVSTNHLRLTKDQLLERDKMIHSFLLEQNIPQSYVMSGGYGKRSWEIYSQFLNYIQSFKK